MIFDFENIFQVSRRYRTSTTRLVFNIFCQKSSTSLASDVLFEGAASRLTPEVVRKVGAVFQWNITVDGKVAKGWGECCWRFLNCLY